MPEGQIASSSSNYTSKRRASTSAPRTLRFARRRLERAFGIIETEDRFVQMSGLEGSGVLAVELTPSTFKAFLLLLLSAATDADVRSEPFTEQLVDSGIYGRR